MYSCTRSPWDGAQLGMQCGKGIRTDLKCWQGGRPWTRCTCALFLSRNIGGQAGVRACAWYRIYVKYGRGPCPPADKNLQPPHSLLDQVLIHPLDHAHARACIQCALLTGSLVPVRAEGFFEVLCRRVQPHVPRACNADRCGVSCMVPFRGPSSVQCRPLWCLMHGPMQRPLKCAMQTAVVSHAWPHAEAP